MADVGGESEREPMEGWFECRLERRAVRLRMRPARDAARRGIHVRAPWPQSFSIKDNQVKWATTAR
eukprot:1983100-Pyramimonas_sp.AAC.2